MTDQLRSLTDMDRIIHEPARLLLVTILYTLESADFLYLLRESGLTKGNLSTHLTRLEQAKYILVEKKFRGKIPQTMFRLSSKGKAAFDAYREQMKNVMDSTPSTRE
jgi:DNA-binding MarR family transcriptional regulator